MSKIVALPWYHRADWPLLHAAFADRAAVPPSYDEWKQRAIAREARWLGDGFSVQRVAVRPDAFLDWCDRHRRDVDYASRRAYAEEMLAQRQLTANVVRGLGERRA